MFQDIYSDSVTLTAKDIEGTSLAFIPFHHLLQFPSWTVLVPCERNKIIITTYQIGLMLK